MGNKNRNKNKNHQKPASNFVIKTTEAEVKNDEEVLKEENVATVESKIPEQTEEIIAESEVEKTEETPNPNETVPETETSDDEDDVRIVEEEKEEEVVPVENTDKIISVADDGVVSTHRNGREFLSEDKFIQKYVNKICHMFFHIDKSLTYELENAFQNFRGRVDQVIEAKSCGFSIFVDTNVREGHHRTVSVCLIPDETWKPEMKNSKCTNLPTGVDRLVFTFHADLKDSAANTARQFFVELAKARVEKIGGFLKHFLTKKMQEHKVDVKLGKISDFKPRKNVSAEVETKVEA